MDSNSYEPSTSLTLRSPAPTKAPALCSEVCALLALRNISQGGIAKFPWELDIPALIELDGWKNLTVDTDLKTMVGQLEGITIDGSGLVTKICIPKRGLSGEFKNS